MVNPLGLPNDLVDVTSAYTIPFITYDLITLDTTLASRLAYGNLWKRKVIAEHRGFIPGDGEVHFHTIYRQINRSFFGTAAMLFSDESLVDFADHTTGLFPAENGMIIRVGGDAAVYETYRNRKTVWKEQLLDGPVLMATPLILPIVPGDFPYRPYLAPEIGDRYQLRSIGCSILPNLPEAIDLGEPDIRFRDDTMREYDPIGGTLLELEAPGRTQFFVLPPATVGPEFLIKASVGVSLRLDGQVVIGVGSGTGEVVTPPYQPLDLYRSFMKLAYYWLMAPSEPIMRQPRDGSNAKYRGRCSTSFTKSVPPRSFISWGRSYYLRFTLDIHPREGSLLFC